MVLLVARTVTATLLVQPRKSKQNIKNQPQKQKENSSSCELACNLRVVWAICYRIQSKKCCVCVPVYVGYVCVYLLYFLRRKTATQSTK